MRTIITPTHVRGLFCAAVLTLSASAFGQTESRFLELGAFRFVLPTGWQEVPESSKVDLMVAQPVDELFPLYRAGDGRLDGASVTLSRRLSEPGTMGELDEHVAGDLTRGLGLLDTTNRTVVAYLPRDQDIMAGDLPKVQLSTKVYKDTAGTPVLAMQLAWLKSVKSKHVELYLNIICPAFEDSVVQVESLLNSLVIREMDIGLQVLSEEPWKQLADSKKPREGAPVLASLEVPASTALPAAPLSSLDEIRVAAAERRAEMGQLMGDLVQQHQNSLVIFEGRQGAGSGFIAKSGPTEMVFTNIHVVAAEQGLRLRRVVGDDLKVASGEAAVDHDIMRFRLPDGTPPTATLEIMQDVGAGVKIGDPVAVLGNSEGAGVLRALRGKVLGIGPNTVETDAEFIPGNSGSPVIHLPSGKVIGIATYLMEHDTTFDEDDRESRRTRRPGEPPPTSASDNKKFRRFAFRMDSVREWQSVNFASFYRQAEELKRSESMTNDIYLFMADLTDNGRLNSGRHEASPIRPYISEFLKLADQSERMNDNDVNAAVARMFSGLRSACRQELGPPRPDGYYDYFWDQFQQQRIIRDRMIESFDSALRRLHRY